MIAAIILLNELGSELAQTGLFWLLIGPDRLKTKIGFMNNFQRACGLADKIITSLQDFSMLVYQPK